MIVMARTRDTMVSGLMLAVAASPASAALPPHFQRATELVAVIETAAGILEFRPIDRVMRMGEDLYRVHTESCTLDVQIVDKPTSEMVAGPRQFTTKAGKPDCK